MNIEKRDFRHASLIALMLLGSGLPGIAQAGGFYLQEQSVKGAGRAFSGEVADQGAASLWWNPAAIGGMTGGDAYLGASAVLPSGDVRNRGTMIIRPTQAPAPIDGAQNAHNPINKGLVPSGAFAYALNPQVALGLAISAPYNFTTDYEADAWTRYTADKTKLRTIDIQPSIAVMPTENISIGVGLNIEYADASLSNYLPLTPNFDGHQELKGDGWDFGWSAGAQYRNGPVSLGLSYKSSIRHKLKGSFTGNTLLPGVVMEFTTPAHATFRTPWQLAFGGRFALSPAVTLNAQVVRSGWGKFDTIRIGAPVNSAIPENYRNTWSFAGGVDYQLSPQWTLRAGIQHDQTPTRDDERDARVPDSDRWNFAAGASYALSPSFTIDAAASYIAFKDADINRATMAAGSILLVDGRLENSHAVVLSAGGRFTF
ncbi:MAG: OmpP1/FadL family transporter [Sphingobium sp.]